VNSLIKSYEKSKKLQELEEKLKQNKGQVLSISGLSDVGKTFLIAALKENLKKPILVLAYNEIEARRVVKDLSYFTDHVSFFPKKEIVTYDYIAESKDLPYARIDVLKRIKEEKNPVIVTTVEAACQKLISKKALYENEMTLEVGKEYNLEKLKENLLKLGYERTDLIEARGSFSVRGGIVDIAAEETRGIRIEFWGDEIDQIRYFNLASQRSIENTQKVTISPAHEYLLEQDLEQVVDCIEKRYLSNPSSEKISEKVKEDLEYIRSGDYISKIDKYFDCFYQNQETILNYLSKEYLVLVEEEGKSKARIEAIKKDIKNIVENLAEKERIIPDALQNNDDYDKMLKKIHENKNTLIFLENNELGIGKNCENISFNFREVNFYKSSIDLLLEDITKSKTKSKTIVILAGNKANAEKFSKLLLDRQIPNELFFSQETLLQSGKVYVTTGGLSTGFECYDLNLFVITGEELFGTEVKRKRHTSSAFKEGEKVVYSDLKIGDYVVHRTHGIGQFIGVNTITADKITKDYIKIKYRGEDILYVPTSNLDSVRKYIGGGETTLKLNKLGSKEWSQTKAKVKSNLREVARELIELYAKRQKSKGYAFSKDTPWQKQFEDNFPYTETDDQLRCIKEVKKDMELDKPMDRLLCGDVGYGKTEVAIRAAFKAVMDQKQVAYLVPTTVLAEQQYQSFKERMEEFPIRVELLNRFRSKKEQETIIKKLKLGEIDVIIGTHRILSKDVEFKDLGLLIIDEEHRFGVKDKEKIKELKTMVDVLTMTATPIPRTLHMSIVGVRDMSVIYDPPQNRRPVQTYVLEYDKEVIKEAITKELEREGQVFYLFNNVEQITKKAEEIAALVPEAKVAFAHGKMTGNELEEIMREFINKKYNVLVCTTILESGIDIPNANTIIVENADRLGLAQLYQIRGRVGRSNRQAYAYITYKRDKLLSEVADKRLKAIKEFTEFGSGFKIAMRDLEIRGAGSLLRRNSTWTYGTSRI